MGGYTHAAMAKMGCPTCGAQAKWAAGKPYCASCGWNVAEAKREVRKRGIAYTVLIVVLVGLMVVGFFSAKEPSMGAFLAGFMVLCLSPIIFFVWVWPWMRLRKVEKRIGLVGGSGAVMAGAGTKGRRTTMMISGREVVVDMPGQAMSGAVSGAMPAPVTGPVAEGGAEAKRGKARFSIGALRSNPEADLQRYKEWSEEKDDDAKKFAQKAEAEAELKRVAALPVPRPVKYRMGLLLKRAAWTLLVFVYLVARPVLREFQRGWSTQALWRILALVGVEAAILGWYRWRDMQSYWEDKRLTSQGAVTLGRVTSQKAVRRAQSEITYVFEDGRGNAVTGKGQDLTRKYFEKMWVVVFYDAANSEKNVSQAGSMYEVG